MRLCHCFDCYTQQLFVNSFALPNGTLYIPLDSVISIIMAHRFKVFIVHTFDEFEDERKEKEEDIFYKIIN